MNDGAKMAVIDMQIVDIRADDRHKGFHKVTCHIPTQAMPLMAQMFSTDNKWPSYENPVPIAAARLNYQQAGEGEGKRAPTPHDTLAKHIPLDGDPARSVHNPLSRRAGIMCADSSYHRYISAPGSDPTTFAASYLRHLCKVVSRKDILPGTDAGRLFEEEESAWLLWRDGPKYVETGILKANKA